MLKLKDVCVQYNNNPVLQNLNLSCNAGDFVTIIGGNGAGKSTLFRAINGELKPNSGSIYINSKNPLRLTSQQKSAMIAKVSQDPRRGTIGELTIRENLAFAASRGRARSLVPTLFRKQEAFFKDKVSELKMGLENRLDETVNNLSGGQRQALSLTMALLNDAKILLLDEHTSALDPKISDEIMELTAKLVAEHKLICLMITHNLKYARNYGNRLIGLKDGKIAQEFPQERCAIITQELLEFLS